MVEVSQVAWDEWNDAHVGRHGVTRDEVEDVCYGDHVARDARSGPQMLIGVAKSGRLISIVLAMRAPGIYYVVTARPASVFERRIYRRKEG